MGQAVTEGSPSPRSGAASLERPVLNGAEGGGARRGGIVDGRASGVRRPCGGSEPAQGFRCRLTGGNSASPACVSGRLPIPPPMTESQPYAAEAPRPAFDLHAVTERVAVQSRFVQPLLDAVGRVVATPAM